MTDVGNTLPAVNHAKRSVYSSLRKNSIPSQSTGARAVAQALPQYFWTPCRLRRSSASQKASTSHRATAAGPKIVQKNASWGA